MDSAMLRILGDTVGTAVGEHTLFHRGIMKLADLDSNPVMQALAAQMLQQPPENMPMLVSLYAQKLEKDLREDLQGEQELAEEETDPLRMENDRLRAMVENLRTRIQLIDKQKELGRLQGEMAATQEMSPNPAAAAAAGGLPAEAGGMPPEAAAAAQQQEQMAMMQAAQQAALQQAAAAQQAAAQGQQQQAAPIVQGAQGVGPVEAAAV